MVSFFFFFFFYQDFIGIKFECKINILSSKLKIKIFESSTFCILPLVSYNRFSFTSIVAEFEILSIKNEGTDG